MWWFGCSHAVLYFPSSSFLSRWKRDILSDILWIRDLQITDAVLLQVTVTWSVSPYDTICKLLRDFNLWKRGTNTNFWQLWLICFRAVSVLTDAVKPIIQPTLTLLSLFTVVRLLQTNSVEKKPSCSTGTLWYLSSFKKAKNTTKVWKLSVFNPENRKMEFGKGNCFLWDKTWRLLLHPPEVNVFFFFFFESLK